MTRHVSHSSSLHARNAALSLSASHGAICIICAMIRRTPWLRAHRPFLTLSRVRAGLCVRPLLVLP
jgi:hypothetical protein